MVNTEEQIPDPKGVDEWLNDVSYLEDTNYIPSLFALEFISFIKLVNGAEGEEHKSPIMHYKMLDQLATKDQDIANLCSRGLAKSAVMGEYLILYLAVYGSIPNFGKVSYALYVSDSIDNGVKKMRKRIERRIENSKFLSQYLPARDLRFTDVRWEFKNIDGVSFVVTGHGVSTGVRGTVELNTRPQLAILDDLVSDKDARSPTLIASIEDIVYKAIDYALHPSRRKIIWSGTPFNAKDPLYKAVESGGWKTNVFPICEKFPCSPEEFKGAWEDRFTYEYVLGQYSKAKKVGKLDSFNQELMLRIMSEEDRLIQDHDIGWYKRKNILANPHVYNFYITTDFATSELKSADFSVISVWAINHVGDWYWVDGICKKQLMDQNINDLFRLVQKYAPLSVGVEISGQQAGFIPWIKNEMQSRNVFFSLAKDGNSNKEGLRPNTDKMSRFQIMVPYFKNNKIYFPEEMKESAIMAECMNELELASIGGFKSKHDDFIDTISMLGSMTVWRPSPVSPSEHDPDSGIWEDHSLPDAVQLHSYIV